MFALPELTLGVDVGQDKETRYTPQLGVRNARQEAFR